MPSQLVCPDCGSCVEIVYVGELGMKLYRCKKCRKYVPKEKLRKTFTFGSRA